MQCCFRRFWPREAEHQRWFSGQRVENDYRWCWHRFLVGARAWFLSRSNIVLHKQDRHLVSGPGTAIHANWANFYQHDESVVITSAEAEVFINKHVPDRVTKAKQLLYGMLCIEPDNRLSAEGAFASDWFVGLDEDTVPR